MTAFPDVHHACAAPWSPKYTWDPDEPRLTRVQGPGGVDVSYQYDSLGRMLTRVSGGVTTNFEWDGWTLVKETTGSVVTRYIAPQGQLHSFERGGQVYQVHSDGHNGSVRAITDATGAVVAHYEFDARGAQLGSSSPFSGGFSFGYVGSLGVRMDAATGLIWMRHRWFDPTGLQRFLSRDVLGGINRYDYCYGNPVNGVDVDGLRPEETWDSRSWGPSTAAERAEYDAFREQTSVPALVAMGATLFEPFDWAVTGYDIYNGDAGWGSGALIIAGLALPFVSAAAATRFQRMFDFDINPRLSNQNIPCPHDAYDSYSTRRQFLPNDYYKNLHGVKEDTIIE